MSKVSHEEFAKVIEELAENGVRLSQLSREIGLSTSALSVAKLRGAIIGDVAKLTALLKGKARRLKSFDPKRHALDYVLREGLIKEARLAKEIGISRQALNHQKDDICLDRIGAIRKSVRNLGETIESLASRLEKIK